MHIQEQKKTVTLAINLVKPCQAWSTYLPREETDLHKTIRNFKPTIYEPRKKTKTAKTASSGDVSDILIRRQSQ